MFKAVYCKFLTHSFVFQEPIDENRQSHFVPFDGIREKQHHHQRMGRRKGKAKA